MLSFIRRHKFRLLVVLLLLIAVGAVTFLAWKRQPRLPGPGDATYEHFVEAFDLGGAALDVDVWEVAEQNLNRAIELIPQEPAAWANRALLNLRTDRLPEAERDLKEAEQRAPENPDIAKLRAMLAERRGRFTDAVAILRNVVEKEPTDVETVYFLAQLIKKEQNPESDAEYQRLMEQILAVRPNNRHVLLERLQIAARRSDRSAVNETLARMRPEASSWTNKGDETRLRFAELEKASAGPLGEALLDTLIPFANMYRGQPGYSRSAEEVTHGGFYRGEPLRTFIKLTPPRREPAPPDTELSFTPEPV